MEVAVVVSTDPSDATLSGGLVERPIGVGGDEADCLIWSCADGCADGGSFFALSADEQTDSSVEGEVVKTDTNRVVQIGFTGLGLQAVQVKKSTFPFISISGTMLNLRVLNLEMCVFSKTKPARAAFFVGGGSAVGDFAVVYGDVLDEEQRGGCVEEGGGGCRGCCDRNEMGIGNG